MDALTGAHEVAPYVPAAVGANGTAVLTRATDATADATVTLGQPILQRIWRREASRPGTQQALADVVNAPDYPDHQAALRARIENALRADPGLVADLAQLLGSTDVTITASGERSVAVQNNSRVISTGEHARVQR